MSSTDTVQTATGTLRRVDRKRKFNTGNLKWRLITVAVVVAVLVIWEAAVNWLHLVPATFLPPPTAVLGALGTMMFDSSANPGPSAFWTGLVYSLGNVIIGVVLAIVVGVVFGLAIGWSPALRLTVAPFLWLLYSTPKVALAPIFILAFGLGNASKIALVFLLAVFPILLNTMEGAVTVQPSLVNAARVYKVNGFAFGAKVLFPATVPYSLAGIQRGALLGFTGEILGEFMGGATGGAGGLGAMIEFAAVRFQMDQALALVIVVMILANLTLWLITSLRRVLAPWDTDQRAT